MSGSLQNFHLLIFFPFEKGLQFTMFFVFGLIWGCILDTVNVNGENSGFSYTETEKAGVFVPASH